MGILSNIPIRFKLIILFATLALFCSAIGLSIFSFNENQRLKKKQESDLKHHSIVIGDLIAPLLNSENRTMAEEILNDCKIIPEICYAALIDNQGKLFADYSKEKSPGCNPAIIEELPRDEEVFREISHKMFYSQTVKYKGNITGRIVIVAEPTGLNIIEDYLPEIIELLFFILFISVVLAYWVQKLVTNPVMQLMKVTSDVIESNDYSVRVSEGSEDELGKLKKNFNKMLSIIELYREKFEHTLEEVTTSEERNRLLLDSSPIPYFTIINNHIVYANNAAVFLLGMGNDEIINTVQIDDVFRFPSDNDKHELLNPPINGFCKINDAKAVNKLNGKEIEVEITSVKVLIKENTSVFLMCLDVSKRKEYERHLLAMNTELEERVRKRTNELLNLLEELRIKNTLMEMSEADLRASRDEAMQANHIKSQFIANISHEIRTPMNVIIGYSELLYKKSEDDEKRRILNSIISNCNTLLSIINDLLDISKIEAGKLEINPTRVDITRVFFEVKDMFESGWKAKGLRFIIDFPEDMPAAFLIDETRLRQVLYNLVSNAIKFTHKGFIRLSAGFNHTSDNKVSVFIEVEDSGIGISQKNIKTIFDAFAQERWHNNTERVGTGLGLTITRRLIESMKGRIEVESRVGLGSKFSIRFRGLETFDREDHSRDDSWNYDEFKISDCRALVVDDLESNRQILKEKLESLGVEVHEAAGAEDTIIRLDDNSFDIIFIDLVIPGMDGSEIADLILERVDYNKCPLVAYTASHDKYKINKELFNDLLAKPIRTADVVGILQKYLPDKFTTEEGQPAPEEEADFIRDEQFDSKSLQWLLGSITEEMLGDAAYMVDTFIIDDIKEFLDELTLMEQRYGIKIFSDYVKRFRTSVDKFDIPAIKKVLKGLPRLRSELEEMAAGAKE